MSDEVKSNLLDSAKQSSKFFECEVTIRLFGVQIVHWVFPPKNS